MRSSQDTLDTKHGATAQFWLQYCKLVELYQLFSRAMKTNDLDLFIYSFEPSAFRCQVDNTIPTEFAKRRREPTWSTGKARERST